MKCTKAFFSILLSWNHRIGNPITDIHCLHNAKHDIHAAEFSDEFNKLCILFEDSLSEEQIDVFHKIAIPPLLRWELPTRSVSRTAWLWWEMRMINHIDIDWWNGLIPLQCRDKTFFEIFKKGLLKIGQQCYNVIDRYGQERVKKLEWAFLSASRR